LEENEMEEKIMEDTSIELIGSSVLQLGKSFTV
jgi:hypothetical protein